MPKTTKSSKKSVPAVNAKTTPARGGKNNELSMEELGKASGGARVSGGKAPIRDTSE